MPALFRHSRDSAPAIQTFEETPRFRRRFDLGCHGGRVDQRGFGETISRVGQLSIGYGLRISLLISDSVCRVSQRSWTVGPTISAALFFGLLRGFVVQGVLGGLAGFPAARTLPTTYRRCVSAALAAAALGVGILSVLDHLIGTW